MGIFDLAKKITHSREYTKSIDEIFVGELINFMYKNGAVLTEINSPTESSHSLTFKFVNHPVLHILRITVDRKIEGMASKILGSQSVLTFEAVIKNDLVEPNDVLVMYQTDFKNMFKIPIFGKVKINHDLNYIIATTTYIEDLGKYIKSDRIEKEALREELEKILNTLVKHLEPLKKKFD
ncbi:TPA: hypothetical protein HA335_05990 [Methanocaldococcus jannaschii]|uniref:Uncharacterized protein MJ1278 n=2 Tax=Methanocaldococcus jannaschii TaxID=2190 RepID=Y1278_METJA|nr:hypothetical protein [Methanocaldococcus jannaschii]Q58674.1 RecName: Full=Uncharacterized protein MJ1278 [Methanocaldococcus jannaschii DSM 2661]AAB99284.1 hypothetical protein MJ_1278 [Methanocaldococcus jannaschii DSM 2661]HII60098.1 hypothetical protein [Methanocaldococcus jannaschii]